MGAEICPQTASRSRAVVQLDWWSQTSAVDGISAGMQLYH